MSDLQREYLDTAIEATTAAADYVKDRFGTALSVQNKSNSKDLVTEVDKTSQNIIEAVLNKRFPDTYILGEESEQHITVGDEPTWIIDPLDGTTNFSRGNDQFSVVIALSVGKLPVVSSIHLPMRDALFTASKDEGAYKNGESLKVSENDDISTFIIGSSQSYDTKTLDAIFNCLHKLTAHVGSFRMVFSTQIELTMVATGEIDAMIVHDYNSWDVAAGALLVQEAGGKVTTKSGEEWNVDHKWCLASNGKRHDQLLELLNTQAS